MLREKLKWVMIGLIAPEVVLYLASSQFLDARRLSKELNVLWRQRRRTQGIDIELDDKNAEEGEVGCVAMPGSLSIGLTRYIGGGGALF